MTDLLIAISGCGGGNRGPKGIYPLIEKEKHWNGKSIEVLAVDTIPPSEDSPSQLLDNIELVHKIALEHLKSYDGLYLVGHSMGGAVAVHVAYRLSLEETTKDRVKGIALLSTQTEGLKALAVLHVPVLFYHGKKDIYFPVEDIEPFFREYQGPKRMIQVKELDHDLEAHRFRWKHAHHLAKHVMTEIAGFLFQPTQESNENIINKELYPNFPSLLINLNGCGRRFWF